MVFSTAAEFQDAKGFGAVELGLQTLGKLARFVGAECIGGSLLLRRARMACSGEAVRFNEGRPWVCPAAENRPSIVAANRNAKATRRRQAGVSGSSITPSRS